jgi:hypothetical protein
LVSQEKHCSMGLLLLTQKNGFDLGSGGAGEVRPSGNKGGKYA